MIASIGADKPPRLQPRHGLHHRAARPEEGAVKLLDYARRVRPGAVPVPDNAPIENWPLQRNENTKALPKAGQTLDDLQRNGTTATATSSSSIPSTACSTSSSRDGARTRLAGVQDATFEPEDGRAAAGALDVGRRRGPADLPGRRALRRVRARASSSTRCASPCARRGAPTCCPRRTGPAEPRTRTCPRMGERFRLRQGLRRLRLPAARPGDPEGPQEVRHVRGRQRQRLAGCRSRPTAASRGWRRCAG